MPPSNALEVRTALLPILRAAGQEALTRFHQVQVEHKADGSPVTEADHAAEAVIVAGISRLWPDDAILSEEGTQVAGRNQRTWHVDPIDGTGAYIHGLAYWGPTVCLVEAGRLTLGAFWAPRLQELWFAAAGAGAWRDDHRLQPRRAAQVQPNDVLFVPSRFHRISSGFGWPGKVRALGTAAGHLALVAGGGAVAVLVTRYQTWDVGCGALLIQESGGTVVDLHGRPVDLLTHGGLPFLAGAPTALRTIVANAGEVLDHAQALAARAKRVP